MSSYFVPCLGKDFPQSGFDMAVIQSAVVGFLGDIQLFGQVGFR